MHISVGEHRRIAKSKTLKRERQCPVRGGFLLGFSNVVQRVSRHFLHGSIIEVTSDQNVWGEVETYIMARQNNECKAADSLCARRENEKKFF